MTQHQRLIQKKIEHLERMASYLAWSQEQIKLIVPITNWAMLTPEQHEYEDNPERLTDFFTQLAAETPVLMEYAERLIAYCKKHYQAS